MKKIITGLFIFLYPVLIFSQRADTLFVDNEVTRNRLSDKDLSFIFRSFDFGFGYGSQTIDFNKELGVGPFFFVRFRFSYATIQQFRWSYNRYKAY